MDKNFNVSDMMRRIADRYRKSSAGPLKASLPSIRLAERSIPAGRFASPWESIFCRSPTGRVP